MPFTRAMITGRGSCIQGEHTNAGSLRFGIFKASQPQGFQGHTCHLVQIFGQSHSLHAFYGLLALLPGAPFQGDSFRLHPALRASSV